MPTEMYFSRAGLAVLTDDGLAVTGDNFEHKILVEYVKEEKSTFTVADFNSSVVLSPLKSASDSAAKLCIVFRSESDLS